MITTKRGYQYEIRAWTGGDVPYIGWDKEEIARDLICAIMDEIYAILGEFGFKAWEPVNTEQELFSLHYNRAVYDAWRTLNP